MIGSIKDNIGHTEAASGVAGLIKAILMMQNGTIPRQANYSTLNPSISPLEPDQMAIPKQTHPWNARRRTAVINNYGAAGSNVAIVLREYVSVGDETGRPTETSNPDTGDGFPFIVAAKTIDSLLSYCATLQSYVTKAQETHAPGMQKTIAYNLARKQNRDFTHSEVFTAQALTDLSSQLGAVAKKSANGQTSVGDAMPVVLCFGGQSGRTVSLCEQFYNNCRLLQFHLVRMIISSIGIRT